MSRPDRIHFDCPLCGTAVRAPHALAGRRAKCGGCHTKIRVPGAPPAETLPEPEDLPALDAEPPRPPPRRPAPLPLPLPPDEEPDDAEERPRSAAFQWVGLAGLVGVAALGIAVLVFVVTRKKEPLTVEPATAPPAARPEPAPAGSKSEPEPEPPTGPDPAADERDLNLLQGLWEPRKVWLGPGITDATNVLGSIITIEGKTVHQKTLAPSGRLGETKATITRLDASRRPKRMDLTTERGEVFRVLYHVDANTLEIFRPVAGVEPPSRFRAFGARGVVELDGNGRFDQCVRLR